MAAASPASTPIDVKAQVEKTTRDRFFEEESEIQAFIGSLITVDLAKFVLDWAPCCLLAGATTKKDILSNANQSETMMVLLCPNGADQQRIHQHLDHHKSSGHKSFELKQLGRRFQGHWAGLRNYDIVNHNVMVIGNVVDLVQIRSCRMPKKSETDVKDDVDKLLKELIPWPHVIVRAPQIISKLKRIGVREEASKRGQWPSTRFVSYFVSQFSDAAKKDFGFWEY
jgi:hypothetical protein